LNVLVCFVSLSFSILRSSSEALKEWKVWVAIVECVLDGWRGSQRTEIGSALMYGLVVARMERVAPRYGAVVSRNGWE
jgi:hypothetical protein